jgi:hypothetical protein
MNVQMVDDIFAPEQPAETPISTNGFVICELSRVSIVIPQADIMTIEHGGELSASLPGESAYGWFACSQGPWPVYALDDRLQLVQQLQTPRSFIVFLRASPWPRGLLVSAVRIVGKQSDLHIQSLPRPLLDFAPGVTGVVRLDATRLAYVFAQRRILDLLADDHAEPEALYA